MMEQFVSGLSPSTTYFYRIEVTNEFGSDNGDIRSFNTPACPNDNPSPSTGTITVIAEVINDNNGNLREGDFELFLNGNRVSSGQANTLSPGQYTVRGGQRSGYNTSVRGACDGDGSVTLREGENLRCVVSNNDIASTPSYSYQSPYNYQSPYSSPYSTPNTYSYQSPYNYQSPYATPYPTPGNQNVTVNLTADDTSIDEDDSTTLRWNSTNATSCTASGGTNGWAGTRATSGTFNTGDLRSDETYHITCSNNINSASDSVTVRVDEDDRDRDDEPDVETRSATNVDETSATLNGRVDGNGRSTRVWFEYSDNRSDVESDRETSEDSVGSGSTTFSERLTGLRANTTYYFRAVAENSEGEDEGSILSFHTGGFVYSYPTPYIYPTPSYPSPYPTPYQTPSTTTRSSLVLLTSSIDRNQPIIPVLDNNRPLPGDEITYTVRYQNVGNASITNLTLQLNLPPHVDYMYSNPGNPSFFGNTLIFSLGTLRANGEGTITVRARVREDAPAGTILNFPALLSYIDPSGNPQTVSANVSAEVWRDGENINMLGANVFGAGFFPTTLLGWLFLIILAFVLAYLAKKVFSPAEVQRVETEHTHHTT